MSAHLRRAALTESSRISVISSMPSHTLFELLALLSAIAIDALTKTELLPLRPEYRSALKYFTCAETTRSLPFPKATVTLRKMSVKEIRQLRTRIMMTGLALSIRGSHILTKPGVFTQAGHAGKGLGLGVSALVVVEPRQVVEPGGNVGVFSRNGSQKRPGILNAQDRRLAASPRKKHAPKDYSADQTKGSIICNLEKCAYLTASRLSSSTSNRCAQPAAAGGKK